MIRRQALLSARCLDRSPGPRRLPRLPAGGQVRAAERGGQQLAERHRAAGGVDQQRRAARLEQELAAAAARQQRVAVAGDDRDRHQRPARPAIRRRRPRGGVACNADTSPHSAHRVRPNDAFSTLQPVTTCPSAVSPAAPTRSREYGA